MSRSSVPENLTCLNSVIGREEWLLRNPDDRSQWILFIFDSSSRHTIRIHTTDGSFTAPIDTLSWVADRARTVRGEKGDIHGHDRAS